MDDGIQQVLRVAKGDGILYHHMLKIFPAINSATHTHKVCWHEVQVAYFDADGQLVSETLPLRPIRMTYPDGHYVGIAVAYHQPTDTLYYYAPTQEADDDR